MSGQHGFASLDFQKPNCGRLELTAFSQLLGFKYIPAPKPQGFSIGFLQDKNAPEKSTTFEEFMAGVIKDKPANIDNFFDGYVKVLFDATSKLLDQCIDLGVLAENCGRPETVGMIKVD